MSEAGDAHGMATRSLSLADPASLVRVYPAHAQFRMVWFLKDTRTKEHRRRKGSKPYPQNWLAERKPCLIWQPEDLRDDETK